MSSEKKNTNTVQNQKKSDTSNGHLSLNGFFSAFKELPQGIFAVSLFGLFLGASTTMVYSQLPLFLINELHTSTATVAFIDGLVEFLAYITRIFSGVISDYLRDRKLILVIGCVVTFLIKPLLAFARSSLMVVIVQSIERIGNGLQASPRDALIADLSSRSVRGGSFGFARSLKTTGALLGTPIAMLIMWLTFDNYRMVFFLATLPVAIALLCLFKIKTPQERQNNDNVACDNKQMHENPFKKKYLKSLDMSFWKVLCLAFIFELGHFSEHMFPVYANNFLSATWAGSVGMFVSIGQVLLSFPIGILADRYGKGKFIRICVLIMILANCMFLCAKYSSMSPIAYIYAGAFLWGGQMTAVQGVFLSLISDQVSYHLRATAIGLYYCAVGVAYIIASNIAGNIWDNHGSNYAFLYSIFCCTITLCVFKFLIPSKYYRAVVADDK